MKPSRESKPQNGIRLKSSLSESQIALLTEWVKNYVASNEYVLKTEGVTPQVIYKQYCRDVKQFPVGPKAFAPMLHLYGLEKIYKSEQYLYVMFNKKGE